MRGGGEASQVHIAGITRRRSCLVKGNGKDILGQRRVDAFEMIGLGVAGLTFRPEWVLGWQRSHLDHLQVMNLRLRLKLVA